MKEYQLRKLWIAVRKGWLLPCTKKGRSINEGRICPITKKECIFKMLYLQRTYLKQNVSWKVKIFGYNLTDSSKSRVQHPEDANATKEKTIQTYKVQKQERFKWSVILKTISSKSQEYHLECSYYLWDQSINLCLTFHIQSQERLNLSFIIIFIVKNYS